MNKNLNKDLLIHLPSNTIVHPCRLIQKDGTLMWKHAITEFVIPETLAQEQHIVKTAQRLEELNSWVSRDLEVWQCLSPVYWFCPSTAELSTGYTVYFQHALYDNKHTYDCLVSHILPHETLTYRDDLLEFKRC